MLLNINGKFTPTSYTQTVIVNCSELQPAVVIYDELSSTISTLFTSHQNREASYLSYELDAIGAVPEDTGLPPPTSKERASTIKRVPGIPR